MTPLDQWGAEVLGRTVWGESRGGSPELWAGVTWSIKNRLAIPERYGATVQEVCLRAEQYDCWMPGAPNSMGWTNWLATITAAGNLFLSVAEAVGDAWASPGPDPVDGATHYYASYIPAPYWAAKAIQTVQIGNTLFFKGVP